MSRRLILLATFLMLSVPLIYAQNADPDAPNQPPPRSDDRTPGESSSKDTRIDLSAPSGDAAGHPNSGVADDVLEMHPYDPHKAEKNIEVGDYYFQRKNYKAAESRYRDALEYKPHDAEATYKLGVALENLGQKEEALASYESYLKILPEGPHAEESESAIDRISHPELAAKEQKKEKKKHKLF